MSLAEGPPVCHARRALVFLSSTLARSPSQRPGRPAARSSGRPAACPTGRLAPRPSIASKRTKWPRKTPDSVRSNAMDARRPVFLAVRRARAPSLVQKSGVPRMPTGKTPQNPRLLHERIHGLTAKSLPPVAVKRLSARGGQGHSADKRILRRAALHPRRTCCRKTTRSKPLTINAPVTLRKHR